MDVSDYQAYVQDLETRLRRLQTELISSQDSNAQLVGPLLAITMLVNKNSLGFAQERYTSLIVGPQWKIADDHFLDLKEEVELMLAGPVVFHTRKAS
jgi:hypothetical protein